MQKALDFCLFLANMAMVMAMEKKKKKKEEPIALHYHYMIGEEDGTILDEAFGYGVPHL